MEGNGMSAYEQFMVAEKTSRHHAGATAITGLTLGSVGLAAALAALTIVPMYANAKASAAREAAQSAKELANAKFDAASGLLSQLTAALAAERQERVQGDINLTATINDSVSGSQASQLTATQQAQLDAYQQMLVGLGTGEYTKCPKKVELYSPAQPFQCGCGCNGQ